jgi:hypothetical protein
VTPNVFPACWWGCRYADSAPGEGITLTMDCDPRDKPAAAYPDSRRRIVAVAHNDGARRKIDAAAQAKLDAQVYCLRVCGAMRGWWLVRGAGWPSPDMLRRDHPNPETRSHVLALTPASRLSPLSRLSLASRPAPAAPSAARTSHRTLRRGRWRRAVR